MARAIVLTLLAALSVLLAGCASKSGDDLTPPPDQTPTFEEAAAPTPNATANATASAGGANATASNNATAGDMPTDPGNCMGGMDMPGCTAAQAARYYAYMEAKAGPRPDETLPPIKIPLTPQGDSEKATISLDEKIVTLLVTVHLNDTGNGPYLALGPGGMGDLSLELKGASTTKTIPLTGSANSVGVDPASSLAMTFQTTISAPEPSAWTLTVSGQGQGAEVVVNLVERFVAS
ncbi:MAG: hypothetical protein QOE90_860 [Thermoplasmata archaeon]|jgi:hypothetical protein|nr:hypothetical protein [Thermoplasmata archaeon]